MTFQFIDACATESSTVCLRNCARFNTSVTVKNEGLVYGASKPNIEKACEGLEIHQKKDREYIRVPIHLPSPLFLVVLLIFSTAIGQMIKMCIIIIYYISNYISI